MRPLLLLGGLAGLLLACSQEKPAANLDSGPPPVPADSLRPAADSPVAPVPDNNPGTAAAPLGASITWPAPFRPAAGKQCVLTAAKAAVVYQRPDAAASKFGQLTAGETVTLAARTADGWVGFDPATAQAANVGVFRLRWVRAAEAFGTAEACAQLPKVASLPSGCLLMAARALPVRRAPRPDAPLLDSVPAGSYARVLPAGRTAEWLPVAVPGHQQPGYVAAGAASLNGPCQ